jgi:hypothetical protein
MDSVWSEYHPPKFLNYEDLYVMLLHHNFNIRTILQFILSLLQNHSSCEFPILDINDHIKYSLMQKNQNLKIIF